MPSLIVKPDVCVRRTTPSPTILPMKNGEAPSKKHQRLSGKLSRKAQRANHYIIVRARAKRHATYDDRGHSHQHQETHQFESSGHNGRVTLNKPKRLHRNRATTSAKSIIRPRQVLIVHAVRRSGDLLMGTKHVYEVRPRI